MTCASWLLLASAPSPLIMLVLLYSISTYKDLIGKSPNCAVLCKIHVWPFCVPQIIPPKLGKAVEASKLDR